MTEKNYGILASISWNSNKWTEPGTEDDLENSNYGYVRENQWMHEDLNFGQELYPLEKDGTFLAYTPMFNKMPSPQKSEYVEAVFFRSLDYKTKKNYIIGVFASPIIEKCRRRAKHKLYKNYDFGNLRSIPDDIILFSKPIEINNQIVEDENLLPKGKKIANQRFNYLLKQNVLNILKKALFLDRKNKKLKAIKTKIELNISE